MIKLTGMVLLIVSCGLLGLYKSLEFSERVNSLTNLKWCFLMIRGDIRYQSAPLPETFYRLSKKMEKRYGTIFCTLSEILRKKQGESFQTIWNEVWEQQEKQLFLQKEDIEVLKSFGESFGYLDREMQMNTLEYLLLQLEEQIKDAQIKKKEGQKLYQTLGVMGGFFLAIIFA